MNLTVLTPNSAPAASRPILDGIAADLGFVPNLAAVTAASPTLLAAFDALRRTVAEPTFTPVHREIAGVATGVAVDNAYGVAFHSTVLNRLGVDEVDIDAMRAGSEPSDHVHAAVYALRTRCCGAARQGRRRCRPACPRRRVDRCRPPPARRRVRVRRSRRHRRQSRRPGAAGRVSPAAAMEVGMRPNGSADKRLFGRQGQPTGEGRPSGFGWHRRRRDRARPATRTDRAGRGLPMRVSSTFPTTSSSRRTSASPSRSGSSGRGCRHASRAPTCGCRWPWPPGGRHGRARPGRARAESASPDDEYRGHGDARRPRAGSGGGVVRHGVHRPAGDRLPGGPSSFMTAYVDAYRGLLAAMSSSRRAPGCRCCPQRRRPDPADRRADPRRYARPEGPRGGSP